MEKINEAYLRMINPWKEYNGGSILSELDIDALHKTATKQSKKTIYEVLSRNYKGYSLEGKNYLECPINGNPFTAEMILLFNNPSLPYINNPKISKEKNFNAFDPENINYFSVEQRKIITENLNLKGERMLYIDDDNSNINNGYDWYKKMYSSLKKPWTKELFSKNVCIIQWFPYPSNNFHEDFVSSKLTTIIEEMYSHKFLVQLVRYAISQGKTVIAMRSVKKWTKALHPNSIKDIEMYENNYDDLYKKNFYINLDNLNNVLQKENIAKPLYVDFDFSTRLKNK